MAHRVTLDRKRETGYVDRDMPACAYCGSNGRQPHQKKCKRPKGKGRQVMMLERKKAAGLCYRCQRKAMPDHRLCKKHNDLANEANRAVGG